VANGFSRMSSNGDVSSERNRRSMTASHLAAIASAFAIICQVVPASPQDPECSPCTEDLMLVFDASGSMSGDGWGYGRRECG
jgi:hypothetical protein